MNVLSPSLIFISSAFFLKECSLHFQMKIRLLAKTYLLSPRYFSVFVVSGRYWICSRHRRILCYQHICFSSFIIFLEGKMSLHCGSTHTAETRGVSGGCSSIAHLLLAPWSSSVCFDSQACQELNMPSVGVALLPVVSLTLGSVPRQCRLQCSLLTGHLSDDEMMSVLGGARREARPRRWQGIQMHSLVYPPSLERQGKQQLIQG